MCQFVFEDMLEKEGLAEEFRIESAATSREEIGNSPHYGTVRKLTQMGVPMRKHYAIKMTRRDYEEYDYIIGMDEWNMRNMLRIVGQDDENKLSLLLDYSDRPRDIADPWYTGNFEDTWDDITEGCRALLAYLKRKHGIPNKSS